MTSCGAGFGLRARPIPALQGQASVAPRRGRSRPRRPCAGAAAKHFARGESHPAYSGRAYVAGLAVDNPDIDVAFDRLVQLTPSTSDIDLALVRTRVRGRIPIAEQLKAKYLLSLEGNDVASGLKWMLASQSVVVMPAPTCESWACEGLLEPYVHYVPVRHDLADLEAVYDRCRANDDRCRAISENASAFIGPSSTKTASSG